jgi:HK97 gp10 family phage protein
MDNEIIGLEGLVRRLNKMSEIKRYEAGLEKAVLLVESEAVKNAPKGEIQQAMASKIEGLEGIVYNPVFYAPYVEYGTGLYAEGGNGRTDVPWVYVEGSTHNPSSKKSYTPETARQAVAILRSEGLEAYSTSGQHPQPFLRPALYDNKEKILEMLGEEIIND